MKPCDDFKFSYMESPPKRERQVNMQLHFCLPPEKCPKDCLLGMMLACGMAMFFYQKRSLLFNIYQQMLFEEQLYSQTRTHVAIDLDKLKSQIKR